ncbi:MAG: response regulator [Pseudomonadota bacterium]
MAREIRILHIDDCYSDALLLESNFSKSPIGTKYKIKHVFDIEQALEALSGEDFDAIILDYCLDCKEGSQNIKDLRRISPTLPLIILTNVENQHIAHRSLQLGIQEFIVKKEADPVKMQFAVQCAIQRKKAETEMVSAHNFNPLTGLLDKKLFLKNLKKRIDWAKPLGYSEIVYILYIENIDEIGQKYNEHIRDRSLLEVSSLIRSKVHEEDLLSHHEDNIFLISYSEKSGDIDKAVMVSEDFIKNIIASIEEKPIYLEDYREFIRPRIRYHTLIYPLIGDSFDVMNDSIFSATEMLKGNSILMAV